MRCARAAAFVTMVLLNPSPRAWAGAAPAGTPAQAEAAAWLEKLGSTDASAAARAEAALAALGPSATPELASWFAGDRRNPAAVPRALRVIGRAKDPAAMRILLLEWEHEESRDQLIDTWPEFGDACVSPLAGYLASARPSQQERIVAALARTGQPAVPALQGLRTRLSDDQSGIAQRLVALIDEAILTAPVVTLARKGRVAWHDLEELAGDPAADARVAAQAARGLIAIHEGDEAPGALMRLSKKPLTPELHALIDPAADDARLIQLTRAGASSLQELGAVVRDPSSNDGLRMGAANALFGLGRAALTELDKCAAALPAGELSAYVKGLADGVRGMPEAPAATPSSAARPAAGLPCLGGASFTELARFDAAGAPVSPRWFRLSPDGTRLLFTIVENGLYRLVVMRADGTERRVIAPFAHQLAPSWSSDGREVAFLAAKARIAAPGEYVDVYAGAIAAAAAGGSASYARVTMAPGPYASPVWMPGRRELIYAANTFAAPQAGGAERSSSFLYRHDISAGRATPLVSLNGRIITAIEASPNGRHIAFLSWGADEPGAGTLQLHLIEADGASPLDMMLAPAQVDAGRRFDAREALLRGGDLTWGPDGTWLSTTGRIIDPVAWRVTGIADPGGDQYAIAAASRTFLSPASAVGDGGACILFDDTRQIMRRCPGDRAPVPVADCRGALLWFDPAGNRLGLFDPLYGVLGEVLLSGKSPVR